METETTQEPSVPPSSKGKGLKITVATVTWNAGDLIERTIHSVEEQIYGSEEHIIIDGNSQDHTVEKLHH